MSRSVDTPSQGGGSHQNLDLAGHKQALTGGPVSVCQPGMMHANAELEGMAQVWILQGVSSHSFADVARLQSRLRLIAQSAVTWLAAHLSGLSACESVGGVMISCCMLKRDRP